MSDKGSTCPNRPARSTWLLIALLVAAAWLLWPPHAGDPPAAQAQIPDPAAQRLALQAELQKVSAELVEIRKLLASGKLHVVVSEEPEGGASKASTRHGP
jgi:hypothetical protein